MPRNYKPGGIEQVFGPDGMVEGYTSTCIHCQHITSFPSMRVMMDYVDVCRGCMELICLHCVGGICMPYDKFCEKLEEQGYRDHQYRKALGL